MQYFCSKCGNELSENDNICPNCGTVNVHTMQNNNNISKEDNNVFANNNSIFVFNDNHKKHKRSPKTFSSGVVLGSIIGVVTGIVAGIIVGISINGMTTVMKNTNKENYVSSSVQSSEKDNATDTSNNVITKENNADTSVQENTSTTDIPNDAILSFDFIKTSMFESYIPGGTYKCGTDIEPGKYIIFPLTSVSFYVVSTDVAKSNILEEGYTVISSIDLKENTYIEMYNDSILVPENDIDNQNLQQYGIFKVGEDIPAGEYKLKTLNTSYQTSAGLYSGLTGVFEIKNNPFDKSVSGATTYITGEQEYISLQEGQYLVLENTAVFPA